MYLIIDVGATYTKYAYYIEDKYQSGNKFPTVKTNCEDFYDRIAQLADANVEKVSISMPGIIENGYVHAISLLPFLTGHHVQNELKVKLKREVLVENDARCATMGEMWKGALQQARNAIMIVLGSGIGATVLLNGQIITSPRHKTGEIGSILMPLDEDYQEMTNFGRNNNANQLISVIAHEAGIDNDGAAVFAYLQHHESPVFAKYCRQIAFMIYNMDYILDLDVAVLGGGISEQDLLIRKIQEEYLKLRQRYEEDDHCCSIKACQHGNHANILGALSRLINK